MHKIGQPLGGVERALLARGLRHSYELLRRAGKPRDLLRKPLRCELGLGQAQRPASGVQHARIGKLVLVERTRERNQDRRSADRGEFRDRAGTRARYYQMRRRNVP